MEFSTILSVSVKWVGEDEVWYFDTEKKSEKKLLTNLVKFLDEADAVIGHNMIKFDMPKIRGRCLVNGVDLPSPYKEIDTYRTASKEFGFESNSLENLANVLGLTPKSSHKNFPGFELWAECLKGNKEAWAEMKLYNIQDIETTEEVYLKMRPYIKNHPNFGVYAESDEILCPKCGSDEVERTRYYYTTTGKYKMYKCKSCGGYHRARTTVYDKEKRKSLTVNVA